MSRTYIHTQKAKYNAKRKEFWIKVEEERIKKGYNSSWYTIQNSLELQQEDKELDLYLDNLHNTKYSKYIYQIKRWYWLDWDSYKSEVERKMLEKDMKDQLDEYYKSKLDDEN